MTRPAGYVYCTPCDEVIATAPVRRARLRLLNEHYDRVHLGRFDEVVQMPAVAWETAARRGLLTLCQSGDAFVVSEVIKLGVPDAPNPRTDWPRLTNEFRDAGYMVATGRLGHSVRPTTNGSPATEWIGTAKAREVAA